MDDASQDGTAEHVSTLAARSPVPVRLIRLSQNSGGPSKPMNVGAAAAQTPYICTLDQDDLMAATRLAVQSRVLTAHPEVAAVIGLLRKIDAAGLRCSNDFEDQSRRRILAIAHERAEDCYVLERSAFYNHVLFEGTLTIGSSTMIRRSAWEAIAGFNLRLRVAWDLDLSCQVARFGPVAFVDHVVGSYRLHGGNTSSQGLSCYREVLAVRSTHLKRPLFPIDGAGLRHDLAQRISGWAIMNPSGATGGALFRRMRRRGRLASRADKSSLRWQRRPCVPPGQAFTRRGEGQLAGSHPRRKADSADVNEKNRHTGKASHECE